jgi:predicted enzyme related to lactoylglutathione lyase
MKHHAINYVEFAAKDLGSTEAFFHRVFGWDFTPYGTEYIAFSGSGLEGGFYQADKMANVNSGSALVVIYSEDLECSLEEVQKAGGTICQDIFAFPGGRRFHFLEPSGNELAIWSDK